MKWINSGFERDREARVVLFWECSNCGFEVPGNGLNEPDFTCPNCERLKNKEKTYNMNTKSSS